MLSVVCRDPGLAMKLFKNGLNPYSTSSTSSLLNQHNSISSILANRVYIQDDLMCEAAAATLWQGQLLG